MKKSFTLIEVLIAIFILTVGILAVFAIFPLGIQIASSSKMATVATYLAQEKIEEVISKSYDEISDATFPDELSLPSPFSAYKRETEVTCFDPNGSSPPNCSDGDTGIKRIEVTVSWGTATKEIELVTLISQR